MSLSPSASNADSSQQEGSTTTKIIEKLQTLLQKLEKAQALLPKLKKAKDEQEKKAITQEKKATTQEKKADDDESRKQKEMQTQLEKVCKELDYIIKAFQKLGKFEGGLEKPLQTLEGNVKDITHDLERYKTSSASLKQIERNLKVLRSNITKVKIQIPLQHEASNSGASRYLQATVASREAGDLPNLYEAADKLEKGSFFQEIKGKYDDLSDGLKLCLLCFAIFPENAEVNQSLLRFWWIGERLTENPALKKKDDVDRVNEILDVLVGDGFIEPVKKKSRLPATSYTMHPIIRSVLIKLAKENQFFDYDSKGSPIDIFTVSESQSKKKCLIKTEGYWLPTQKPEENPQKPDPENQPKPDPKKQQEDEEKKRREWEDKKKEYLDLLHRHLAELQTVFNVSRQFPDLLVEQFSKMNSVSVLYLGRWERTAERHMEVERTDFLKGLEIMKRLRLFSLQGISGIEKLQDSLCKLVELRILDLRACHNLVKLPKQLGSLKKLAYLDMSECYLIDDMPRELASLSELRVLKGFVISARKKHSCTLEHLEALKSLEKLTINVNSKDFSIDEGGQVLSKFVALRKLRIAWGALAEGSSKGNGNKESKAQQNGPSKSGPTATNTFLKLMKKPWGGTCGEGTSKSAENKAIPAKENGNKPPKLTKLEKLDLQCFPEPKPPSWLVPGSLESLKSLYIRGGNFSYLGDIQADNTKWQVESLRLKYLVGVQINWKDLQTQFPKLKYLERVKCPGITGCPCDANGVWQQKS